MSGQRILLVLTGDAFRHVNGRPYIDPENFNDQKTCSFSQLRFLQSIKPVEADIFINTYTFTSEYDEALKSWYPNVIRYVAHNKMLGERGLIDNTISHLREMDLTPYEGVLFIRIDLFIREYFNFVFRVREESVVYAHLDSNRASGGHGLPYPGICHNITYVPRSMIAYLLEGIAWKRHESANLLCKKTNKIKFYSNTFHSCDTAQEWNPFLAMAGRDEPQVLWCSRSGNRRGQRFNWITLETAAIPNDYRFDYMLGRDTRVKWKSNPEALLVPKKRVVIYANCQGGAIQGILAYSKLADEYDVFGAHVLENYIYMNTNAGLPYDILAEADLFIYQPISSDRGQYSSAELLKTLKPGCKAVAFPYLYNYAFWEILAVSDADHDFGVFGMKYAHLNQKPITNLRDTGVPFEEVERRIRTGTIDWRFAERFATTQSILREKEKECDVKVADFIDANYRDHVLFYTQNHPSMFFLRYVCQEILKTLDCDPSSIPDEHHLIYPDYNAGHHEIPHYEMGEAAWKHFGFRFIPKPGPHVTENIVAMSRLIYNGEGVGPRCVSTS